MSDVMSAAERKNVGHMMKNTNTGFNNSNLLLIGAWDGRRVEELRASGQDVPFPGWERLRREASEQGPRVFLTVTDAQGKILGQPGPQRRLDGAARPRKIHWADSAGA